MKSLLLTALLIVSYQAMADDSVHSIVRGQGSEPHLVKMNSGEVKFVEQGEEYKLLPFEAQLKVSEADVKIADEEAPSIDDGDNYVPTPIADSEVQNIWNRMNPYIKRKSECSDRAHVWAYDEFQKSGTKSQKAFLLLTDTYIKRTRFKWWFHVAPMYVTTSGRKIVMDYQFLDHPVEFNVWKNLLVFSKRECVTEFSFLAYNAGADQTQDCYTKHSPMYYYVPGDIGSQEQGHGKTTWSVGEVNGARSRAFFKGSL